jgi:hypothetical protein
VFHNTGKVTFYQILFQLKKITPQYQQVRLLLSFQNLNGFFRRI